MNLKSALSLIGTLCVFTTVLAQSSTENLIVLDLSKAITELKFNSTTGAWTGTYDDDETEIESQVFSFVHNSMSDYNTWWGFTASNSVNNSKQANFLTYQFSNMGLGGIALNEDGSIKTDRFGAPVTSSDMPYLVAFAMTGFSRHPADMTFNTEQSYEVVGAYFNLNSYTYYTVMDGDAMARAFTNGDKLTLVVHGVAPDGAEKTVDVEMASYANGNITINRGWSYVDLSALGVVDQIWFSMTSTDSGAYGMNTPAYFCMDKLMVRPADNNSLSNVQADNKCMITYDRSTNTVHLNGNDFAMVFDQSGRCVMSSDTNNFSIKHLSAGIYIIKSGNSQVKIAR